MSSPLDNNMDIDHQDFHLGTHKSNQDVSFDPAKFDSAVCDAIQEFQDSSTANPPPFQFSSDKFMDDLGILLYLVIKTFLRESRMNVDMCKQHLLENLSLFVPLKSAYTSRSFASLLSNDAMPPEVIEHAPKQGITPSSSGGLQDLSLPLRSLQSVFKAPYIGDTANLLIETLNHERTLYPGSTAANSPYNWSISVIQSSGMGKSRMVEEAGKTVFTLPINIREEAEKLKKAYPPPDDSIRQFFEERLEDNDKKQQMDYMILLREMFIRARILVNKHFPGLTGAKLALAWATYLGEGQTDLEVGPNRRQFYTHVVAQANKQISKRRTLPLDELERSLRTSCAKLVEHLQPAPGTNACFAYFDEAHSLTKAVKDLNKQHQRNQFHNLGHVLSKLISFPIFFIFLLTNSSLKDLAPPVSYFTSEREIQGSQLIAPFTELPFDIHEDNVIKEFRNGLMKLERACKVDVMVCFGRPLWTSLHKIDPHNDIFHLAMNKLCANGIPGHEADSILAALGVRIGIKFDGKEITCEENGTTVEEKHSYLIQSKLVESHMRVAYSIPQHRVYMHTGSPSEPVLAEAAGRYLSSGGCRGIVLEGPKQLFEALEKGFLARGERGELVGRLLVTVAHDLALLARRNHPLQPILNQPFYHRPIPVLDFLYALFHKDHHRKIRNAKSITHRKGNDSLGKAFSNSFVFFSHFALAGDSDMLSVFGLTTALVRGMAIQAKDGQESIDAVIPIHMGTLKDPISAKTTSAINLQIKNRKGLSHCKIDRSITVPNARMPVLSIILELGITGKRSGTIIVPEGSPPRTRNKAASLQPDDHHYEIIARGCSSKLFGPVTPDTQQQYKALLGEGSVWEDFARCDREKNLQALQAMKPEIDGKQQKERYFDTKPEQ